jgi:hypothetical protein
LTALSSPTKPKIKPNIPQNVHLGFSSNFTKINFNSKTREILLRFKMVAGLKIAVKKWFLLATYGI